LPAIERLLDHEWNYITFPSTHWRETLLGSNVRGLGLERKAGFMSTVLRFCIALLSSAVLIAQPLAAQTAGLHVVVTSKPIHALVADIMQGMGTPQLLVDGTASPHTFSMRPSDAQKLSRAGVFFRVSEALEPFTAKVVRALPRSVKTVTLAEAPGVTLLQRRTGGPFEAHKHSHTHGKHKHGSEPDELYDAHVWLDPANAKAMARAIASTLAEVAPAEAARFNANADALAARLDDLSAALKLELAPVAERPFVVLHDAYQYFEKSFGLSAIGSILVDPDEQPSARRISDLRRKVGQLSAVCAFAEPGQQPKIVASVTEGTPTRRAILDPEGIMLEPGPDLYFKLMRGLANTMKTCLAAPA
jgi:zinc transport system substrate-binding protein